LYSFFHNDVKKYFKRKWRIVWKKFTWSEILKWHTKTRDFMNEATIYKGKRRGVNFTATNVKYIQLFIQTRFIIVIFNVQTLSSTQQFNHYTYKITINLQASQQFSFYFFYIINPYQIPIHNQITSHSYISSVK